MPTRRLLLAALPSLLAGSARAAAAPPVVTILGDSITAGLGLPAAQALPAQLEAILRASGTNVRVRGAGVSGDTTAGGLARLDFSVQSDTAVCVVALGGNDLLQGVEPAQTRVNLERIVRRLKARRIAVVLAGGRAPGRSLGAFGRDFDAVFPSVARDNRVLFAPDLLAGVSDRPELKQADGLHPNVAGARLMARRLAPVVTQALRAARR
jgi:acyl-CoA thioesterase-1